MKRSLPFFFLAIGALMTLPAAAQQSPQGVHADIEALEFPPLRFTPPTPAEDTIRGVRVFFLEDRSLPLVSVYASFRGGYGRFPRSLYAASLALPGLLRTGGTTTRSPDSVDSSIEGLALSMSFGQGGGGASASFNSLTENLDEAFDLWGDLLKRPGFDSAQVEVWRGRELERLRRRRDNPGSLAFSTFNNLMFGDHPVGWQTEAEDLEPEDLSTERLSEVHQAMICPENLMLAIAGDIDRAEAHRRVDALLSDWAPCPGPLADEPEPVIRELPGVFVLHKEIEQTQVVMAHVSSLRQGATKSYFASRIGNSILGASGLSSRLMREVRTRAGYAYAASSIWSAPLRRDGLVGAITQTRPETTVPAVNLIRQVVDSMRTVPPEEEEVNVAIEEIVNGFVFNFQSPFQIAARHLTFARMGLPRDWLERFVTDVQDVTPQDIQETYGEFVDPDDFTILIVGDTTKIGSGLAELGTVTYLDEDGQPIAQEADDETAATDEDEAGDENDSAGSPTLDALLLRDVESGDTAGQKRP